jgi:hypothetical protein
MDRHQKLFQDILMRKGDANVLFGSLCGLLRRIGFQERIRGDHHIFSMANVDEIINIQPMGTKSKPYQVKQIRDLILRYDLKIEE